MWGRSIVTARGTCGLILLQRIERKIFKLVFLFFDRSISPATLIGNVVVSKGLINGIVCGQL